MLPIDLGRVALEQADQAEQLVDFVQMVHPVVVLHHAAQVAGALADQTVVGLAEQQPGHRQAGGARVERIGQEPVPLIE